MCWSEPISWFSDICTNDSRPKQSLISIYNGIHLSKIDASARQDTQTYCHNKEYRSISVWTSPKFHWREYFWFVGHFFYWFVESALFVRKKINAYLTLNKFKRFNILLWQVFTFLHSKTKFKRIVYRIDSRNSFLTMRRYFTRLVISLVQSRHNLDVCKVARHRLRPSFWDEPQTSAIQTPIVKYSRLFAFSSSIFHQNQFRLIDNRHGIKRSENILSVIGKITFSPFVVGM